MTRSTENYEQIYAHVETYIGPIEGVFREIISDNLSIDIIVAAPTSKRNCYTFVTYGMSELPMTVPEGAEEYRYAELMICLPPTWKISDEDFKDERNYWPVRALKTLARFPHEYHTWLYMGHTLANGEPVKPYSEGTKFQGMLLSLPDVEDKREFFNLTISDEKVIHFFTLVPIYQEEMDYKLKNGMEALFAKLNKIGTDDVVNLNRKNTCKKVFGLF
ncbi:suppressor of fused domain protein [Paenibacillus sinopodophylli]|uniref:suppressor of fused domain protein n=1 Tax=Paenibacillus sinopodophylli TaxID=1837342 RepID=UPI00110CB220|nr:suppressor of fused domain protein [Paenibacillus sinopodophylli]